MCSDVLGALGTLWKQWAVDSCVCHTVRRELRRTPGVQGQAAPEARRRGGCVGGVHCEARHGCARVGPMGGREVVRPWCPPHSTAQAVAQIVKEREPRPLELDAVGAARAELRRPRCSSVGNV